MATRNPGRTIRRPAAGDGDPRGRIVAALLEICRSLERMQTSTPARRACREVAGRLAKLWGGRSRRGPARRR